MVQCKQLDEKNEISSLNAINGHEKRKNTLPMFVRMYVCIYPITKLI